MKRIKKKKGEGYVDSGVKILIAVVIGALVLSGFYALFKNNIMPATSEKVVDMFDYSGNSDSETKATAGSATFTDGTTLSWDDLMLPENGTKYGYSADKITATSIDNNAFQNCTQITDIVIQDGVTTIGVNAFGSCTKLKTVDMTNSVNNIDANVFNGCGALVNINLSTSITILNKGVFQECQNLKSIVLPNSITTIGQQVFMYCYNLEEITLSSNLETIDYFAFKEANKLKEIRFPVSIKTLKWGSFSESCVKDFYYEGTKAQWQAIDKNNWAQYLSGYTVHCSDGDV